VKILLNSHAHFDHAEGLAHIKKDSGAQMVAASTEAPALESGTPPSEMSYGVHTFAPVKVDRRIGDGGKVQIGQTILRAVLTPGHTPGCTSWTTTVTDRGKPVNVVFLCSITVAGSRLIGNKGYPGIVADFRKSFARLDKLPVDVVLPFHPELNDVLGRAARRQAGDADAFVHPGELTSIVAAARTDFEGELAKAQAQ